MRRSYHHPAALGDMVDQDLDIWCWCNGCYHYAVLSPDMLIARLGRDQGVPSVADHAYCGHCGSRDVETRPNWPTVGVVAGHSRNESMGPPG